MNKQSTGLDKHQSKNVTFIDFWCFIATELGNSRLRVNAKANSINEFLDQRSDHKEYLKSVIRRSYKLGQCQHLRSPINVNHVLDLLGEAAYQLKGKRCDDLLDIELLEEIAWHISGRFAHLVQNIEPITQIKDTSTSNIVSFHSAKTRRANRRWL